MSNDNKNDIKNIVNNDKYSLKESFVPKTEETSMAHQIASKLNDLNNYAFHRRVVKQIGPQRANQLLHETLDDVKQAKLTTNPIRNPAALFNWKMKTLLKK